MRRAKNLVLLVVIIIPILLASMPVSAQVPPATDLNIWASAINYSDDGFVATGDLASGPNCEYKDIKYRKVVGPVLTSGVNSYHIPAQEFLSSSLKQCITSNTQGAFGTQYYAHDGNTANMMRINASRNGNYFSAVPASNKVFAITPVSSLTGSYISLYNDFNVGKIVYTGSGGVNYDIDWAPLEQSQPIKYIDNQYVLTNGQEYSSNGKYMVAKFDGYFAKVNLSTLEMTPFYYLTSVNHDTMKMAISGDGRYVTTSINGKVLIHDTLNCQSSYRNGNWEKYVQTIVPAGCTSTSNLYSTISSVVPGFGSVSWIKFSPNGSEITVALRGIYSTNSDQIKKVKLVSSQYSLKTKGYLALGDSFSAGEGDTEGEVWYEPGTDEQGNKDTFAGRNLCHLSRRSYPYLMALQLGYISTNTVSPSSEGLFHSVACSGAVINNVVGGTLNGTIDYDAGGNEFKDSNNQYRYDFFGQLGGWQPGRIRQLDIFDSEAGAVTRDEQNPEVITIGIGGNDVNFGDMIKACTLDIASTCKYAIRESQEAGEFAQLAASQKPRLVEVYKSLKIRNPDSRIYVHGYPVFVQGYNGNCDTNVLLNSEETALVEEGARYLNSVVKASALEAGVFYVDVTNILEGTNLCSNSTTADKTVNGVTEGNDKVGLNKPWLSLVVPSINRACILSSGCLGNESFHPNPKAHKLYEQAILTQTNNLTALMPNAVKTPYPTPDLFFGNSAREHVSTLNLNDGFTPQDIIIKKPGHFLSYGDGIDTLKINQSAKPGTTLKIIGESVPIQIGEYTIPDNGDINLEIGIPDFMKSDPGAHEIHLIGTDNFGEQFDVYEQLIVGNSLNDFDGDGIANEIDSCVTVKNINIDIDNDGIDDACDSIAVAPVVSPPPTIDPTPTKLSKLISFIKFFIKKMFSFLYSSYR